MAKQPDAATFTADEFIAWSLEQPEGCRYELEHGHVVAMGGERMGHVRAKTRAHRSLEAAIDGAGLDCEAVADGIPVRIDDATVYLPDSLMRCGSRLPDDATEIGDPVVVVEAVSPSTRSIDSGAKLEGYFRLRACSTI